jgi:hypothetical protein
MVGRLYLEHLTDADLALLTESVDQDPDIRRYPERIVGLLDRPAIFQRLFGASAREPLLQGSPFLVFSVLVHRAARDLRETAFVEEWVGPRQRVPVFDVAGLRDFGADPMRRLFLAELLASYTHVASGSVLVRTSRGWRRRRFSELDPIALLDLAEAVPASERPAVSRRLGDLALFLTGIFPDSAGGRLMVGRQAQRIERALGPRHREDAAGNDGIWLLERLGRHAYALAQRAADRNGAMAEVLAAVTQNFANARRVLNFVTDRYLFPTRRRWFGLD